MKNNKWQKPTPFNLNKLWLLDPNQWNIPELKPLTEPPPIDLDFVGFNHCKSLASRMDTNYGVHFFLDDYQFARLWNNPYKYISLLKKFEYILTPDFSLYRDYPKAIQLFQHYRKHWVSAYMQSHGIRVVPTIGWSDSASWEWCFDGMPTNSVVAVSSIGTQKDPTSRRLFLLGYAEMEKRLSPTLVLFWGNIPKELKDKPNIRHLGYTMDEKFALIKAEKKNRK